MNFSGIFYCTFACAMATLATTVSAMPVDQFSPWGSFIDLLNLAQQMRDVMLGESYFPSMPGPYTGTGFSSIPTSFSDPGSPNPVSSGASTFPAVPSNFAGTGYPSIPSSIPSSIPPASQFSNIPPNFRGIGYPSKPSSELYSSAPSISPASKFPGIPSSISGNTLSTPDGSNIPSLSGSPSMVSGYMPTGLAPDPASSAAKAVDSVDTLDKAAVQ